MDPLETFKCVLVGDGSVGRSSIIERFLTGNIGEEKYSSNIFQNFVRHFEFNQKKIILDLWDSQIGEEFKKPRLLAYTNADVFIVCFSLYDISTLESISTKWIPEIRQISQAPVVLVGTKLDLEENNEMIVKSVREKVKNVMTEIGAEAYVECSALSCKNITEIFEAALNKKINFVKQQHEETVNMMNQ